jgi:hypothetical protein
MELKEAFRSVQGFCSKAKLGIIIMCLNRKQTPPLPTLQKTKKRPLSQNIPQVIASRRRREIISPRTAPNVSSHRVGQVVSDRAGQIDLPTGPDLIQHFLLASRIEMTHVIPLGRQPGSAHILRRSGRSHLRWLVFEVPPVRPRGMSGVVPLPCLKLASPHCLLLPLPLLILQPATHQSAKLSPTRS